MLSEGGQGKKQEETQERKDTNMENKYKRALSLLLALAVAIGDLAKGTATTESTS